MTAPMVLKRQRSVAQEQRLWFVFAGIAAVVTACLAFGLIQLLTAEGDVEFLTAQVEEDVRETTINVVNYLATNPDASLGEMLSAVEVVESGMNEVVILGEAGWSDYRVVASNEELDAGFQFVSDMNGVGVFESVELSQ